MLFLSRNCLKWNPALIAKTKIIRVSPMRAPILPFDKTSNVPDRNSKYIMHLRAAATCSLLASHQLAPDFSIFETMLISAAQKPISIAQRLNWLAWLASIWKTVVAKCCQPEFETSEKHHTNAKIIISVRVIKAFVINCSDPKSLLGLKFLYISSRLLPNRMILV